MNSKRSFDELYSLENLLYEEMQGRFSIPVAYFFKAKRCQFSFCLTLPTYGEKDGESVYCSVHKLPGMWKTSMQKKNKTSGHTLCHVCNTRAYYGNALTSRRFCKFHMNSETDWRITFCCICHEVAIYENDSRLFCLLHAPNGSHMFAPSLPKVSLSSEKCDVFVEEKHQHLLTEVPWFPEFIKEVELVKNPLEEELNNALDL